ncbi:MFS transporter [Rhodococcus sp. NM-2]|uniref:MFS transporter n=1 Tax=Rhodococcus sp. NM-2 TaxID=3401174 RepID=UPI003AACED86
MSHTAGADSTLDTQRADGVRSRVRQLYGGAFGNFIEWYDWNIYGFMAVVFAPVFFPGDVTASLTYTLATFAIGFISRPLGAIVLSPYGDRRGRRFLLSLTVLLMGFGSLIIAAVPSYNSIGYAAPAILLIARLIQGLGAGGEFQSAAAYIVESAPAARRALFGSFQNVSGTLGVLAASGLAAVLTATIDETHLVSWGWRIAFLLGAGMALFGFVLRRKLPDTPAFEKLEQANDTVEHPLREALKNPIPIFYVFGMQAVVFSWYLWVSLLPTIAKMLGGLPLNVGLLGTTVALVVIILSMPIVGWVSDRIHRRKPIMIAHSLGLILFAIPAFLLLKTGDATTYFVVCIVGAILVGFEGALVPTLICELFPARHRLTGVGLSYSVSTAIFGGGGAVLAGYFATTGSALVIAGLLIAQQLLSLFVFIVMPETAGKDLSQ